MNRTGTRNLSFLIGVSFLFAWALPMAGQANFNLSKEVSEKKGAIVWKDAPPNALPDDVCTMLQVCSGPIKLIALPPVTEKGLRVGRALFLAEDAKKANIVVLERQTTADVYFFLLGPDGNLQKAAYLDLGRPVKQWVAMGSAVAKPQFDQDKTIWHEHVLKLGAPAPAAQGN